MEGYIINISKVTKHFPYGKHFFTTQGFNNDTWKDVYASLKANYPEPEWKIRVTYWESVGRAIDTTQL